MKKFITTMLVLAVAFSAIAAPKDKKKKEEAEPAPKQDTVKVEPLKVTEGLFGVSNKGNDWFFDIPEDIMGRRILTVTRYHSNTVDAGKYGGEEINENMIYFEKASNGNILLRADILSIKADEKDAIYKAVKVSSENPIIASFKPEKGGTNRIKVNTLFESDNQAFSFSSSSKRPFNLGGIHRDASFINSIRTYPINTEVTVTKTFAYNAPTSTATGSSQSTRLPAGTETGVVTMVLNTSFVLLPETPMQPRMFDPRVGFFADGYTIFADDQQSVEDFRFIARYRLEAKPEDIEKQKRGELVEPIKPIIYYIDPATPKQWVPYLIAGVNDWNVAFEAAGWKNAIRGEEWPVDNPDMSLEDARFCVIRYLASPTQNAYGPNVHDPRSGEIIESHVGWYHNVMSLVHDWYQIQAGAVDPRARSMKYSDELMGDLIRFVSSHEVGHTLGLRHNMGSSAQTPVEKLRDKAWVEANGYTVSIMDYARFNYVAQPEDNIGKAGLYPKIGDYDKWAIEFGYRPTYIEDVKEDHLYWNKVIINKLNENPRLWFGGEGRDSDPRAQTEDLGDDSMKASEYGIKNLQRVIVAIPEWNKEEADMYANIKRMYENVISQFNRYTGHVTKNIGGRYITERSIEQPGPKYEAVPKDKQKRALQFLNDQLFKKPTWLVDVPYIMNLTDRPDSYLYTLVNNVVSTSGVLEMAKLTRMEQFAQMDKNNYKPEEYLSDLTGMIFEELNKGSKVDSYRRYLQRRFVTVALEAVNASANAMADGRILILAELQKIESKAKRAAGDAVTKAHWQAIAKQIEDGLEPAKK
ncbi:MAG: zinc-dependent metalloprotease [Bacteroidales bacterium]|nr:zinc-dependent metalloprotease [Bacteroidales bacterium]